MTEDLYKSLIRECEREDDLGVVIRTQIIVEQYLNKLIGLLVVRSDHVRKMQLDYYSTVQLAFALGLDPRFEKALNCLGKIRNDFAHNIRPEISKSDVNNFYSCLAAFEKETLNNGAKKAAKVVGNIEGQHKKMSERQQFINIVVVLAAAIHTACGQAPNKLRRSDTTCDAPA